jgi:hypothetical protein
MADYSEILDTQIEPDAPLTAVLAGQWRDNPIAIVQSSPDAPRPLTEEQFRAAQPFVVSPGEVVLGPFVHSGSFSNFSNLSNTFNGSNSITIKPNVSGTIRFRADFTVENASMRTDVRLLKNGVEVFLNIGTVGAAGSVVTDQTAVSGDVFIWQVRREVASGSAGIQPSQPLGNDSIEARPLFTYTSQA